ncbi:hypothetical protein [Bacillus nakamurai]|uniref:hypothetical protein n=1 Tax=Bacillus nakamurai TaxID=1793963 RepID=UPI0020C3FDC7|nr:hypothetical protein [Bacillus nakamurai]MCP6682957.1 hypothetical protein [Bacillus nakamurai]
MMKKFLILNTEDMRFALRYTEEEAVVAYKDFVRDAVEYGFRDGTVILTEIKKEIGVLSIVEAALDD